MHLKYLVAVTQIHAFHEMHLFAAGRSEAVALGGAVKPDGIDNKYLSLPMADRVAVDADRSK
jgi:hypothetical protein